MASCEVLNGHMSGRINEHHRWVFQHAMFDYQRVVNLGELKHMFCGQDNSGLDTCTAWMVDHFYCFS